MGSAESKTNNAKFKNKNNEPELQNDAKLVDQNKGENDDDSEEEFSDCTNDFDSEEFRVIDSNKNENDEIKNSCEKENCGEERISTAMKNEGDVTDCNALERSLEENINRNSSSDSHDSADENESPEEWKQKHKKQMDDFYQEMNKKREFRQKCVQNLRDELKNLRDQLAIEKETNTQLTEMIDQNNDIKNIESLRSENVKLKAEISELQMNLQTANSENLSNTQELLALREQSRSLKEAVAACKEMLGIRENQVDQLKAKLKEIEEAFAEKEVKIMSTALQQEYQRQLENIRRMRELYEERANLLATERDEYKEKLKDREIDLKSEIEKSKSLEDYISTLENNLKVKNTDIGMLESEIGILKSEKAQTQSEMNSVNQLISQILLGFNANGNNLDIDKLINMLEENRDLLNEMAIKEESSGIEEGAFLPKLLYDLFLQVNGDNENTEKTDDTQETKKPLTADEVAEKLPKVWRVLIELLSHHKKLNEIQLHDDEKEIDDCYNSIQTASGPQAVLSVSKTFVKLKDLILEKKSLQKDTNRLKALYSHLEHRLDKQEKRLSAVSVELTKTWNLVGKIKRQHRNLHTNEQILVYQLQQKRKLLNELKEELEYCRKKWAAAREKNDESEIQCKLLRQEFTKRKLMDNNSAESGYSDEHPSDVSEDEGAGPSKNANKKTESTKFDHNLDMFERTMSPTYSERRRSESPALANDIDFAFSRAQSEPPVSSQYLIEFYNNATQQVQLPQRISECDHVEMDHEMDHLDHETHNTVLVTQPPPILVSVTENKPKAQLSSSKTKNRKKPKLDGKNKKKTETAEEMFLRLSGILNPETEEDTCETDDDDESEESSEVPEENARALENNVENTEEASNNPLDDIIGAVCEELQTENTVPKEIKTTTCMDEIIGAVCTELLFENQRNLNSLEPPNPTTSQGEPKANLSVLTATEQEYLDRRAARLARLEAEAQAFYDRLSKTKKRGEQMSAQIDDIHNSFIERERQKEKANKAEKEAQQEKDNEENTSQQDLPSKEKDTDQDNNENSNE